MSTRFSRFLAGMAVVAAYALAGRLGAWIGPERLEVFPLWPAAGLALAGVLVAGVKIWPALFVGAFAGATLSPLSQGADWHWAMRALILASAETFQVLTAGMLLRWLAGGAQAFERPQTVLRFAGIAGVCMGIAPGIALVGLRFSGLDLERFSGETWFHWWVGNVLSAAVLTPVLVTWWRVPEPEFSLRRKFELGLLLVILIVLWELISLGPMPDQRMNVLLNFLVIPVLLWAALRFGQHGATTAVLVLACVVDAGLLRGNGLFGGVDRHLSVSLMNGFVAMMAIMTLTLAADAAQRLRAQARHIASEQEIRRLNAELEQRVQDRTRQLEAINKELEAFSYSVSHDLRAPLRSIRGFSEVLLERYRDRLDSRGQDFLRRACDSCAHMDNLIEDLLKLSRVGRSDLQPARVELTELAKEIATELNRAHSEREVEFSAEPGLHALGDERLLRLALENLLRNAWKFTGKAEHPKVQFGRTESPEPAFFVRDNGAGFDMAYASKLFGVFQRLHSATEFPGTGIGLATVQRIINRHGGRTWAHGTLNGGATFYFTLPTEERK